MGPVTTGGAFDAEHHRRRVRELAQEPPDEPTYCELKRDLSYADNAGKAELVKDVASFANAPLEHHGGFGYLIFGVAPDGSIAGVLDPLPGDPVSEIRNLLNRYLERPVAFEFLTTSVEVGGETRQLAAVVVPNSRRRPHVVSRELTEQQGKKTKHLLRAGDLWVRKAGGRELATAEDLDALYEAKLLSAARDATEPLARRVEDLEGELARLRSAAPEPSFGVAPPGGREPVREAEVRPAKDVLFTPTGLQRLADEVAWARMRAGKERREGGGAWGSYAGVGLRPGPDAFEGYARELEAWLSELDGFVMVELALSNTGEAPAEDVSVEVWIPHNLAGNVDLPSEQPERPRDLHSLNTKMISPKYTVSKQNSPEALIGPELDHDRRLVIWEVGRLYHGRPVRTESEPDYVNGLLLERGPFERATDERGFVELPYAIRSANLPRPVEGALRLLPVSGPRGSSDG